MSSQTLEQLTLAHPDLAEAYGELGQQYSRKLWHQLTESLAAFFSNEGNAREDNFVRLFRDFVQPFASKLDQLLLVQLAIKAVALLSEQEALEVLGEVAASREQLGEEAWLLCDMRMGVLKLRQGRMEEVKAALEAGEELLEATSGAEPVVHAAVHDLACQYYEQVGPPDAYYRSATQLLAYTQLDDMTEQTKHALAVAVSLAALTGEGIYNFGEVLQTPILEALLGTPQEWLRHLMLACNEGAIERFNQLVAENAAAVQAQPGLASRLDFCKEKIALMSLVELVFRRPADQRVVAFAEIAQQTMLPAGDVELLVMRAMSLELIKGQIDQVDETVAVTYVQPRVLGNDQLAVIAQQLDTWGDKVQATLLTMRDQTEELRAAEPGLV